MEQDEKQQDRKPIIITVNRQVGSGGFVIAGQLAERLSAVYVDKKILAATAKELDEKEAELKKMKKAGMTEGVPRKAGDEKKWEAIWKHFARVPISSELEFYHPDLSGMTMDQQVHEKEEEILNQIVGSGPAVILGRGGFYRMKDHPYHVSVFINATREYRINNISNLYGLSREDAMELMKKTNEARAKYTYRVTGRDVLDVRNYDLAVDSGKLGASAVTDFILDYVKIRFGERF